MQVEPRALRLLDVEYLRGHATWRDYSTQTVECWHSWIIDFKIECSMHDSPHALAPN
ncbi:hypothetical protein GCM10007112_23790 [Vulcanisaeta souniana JCM 11219]|uniref:Uncharacterized protein n=1 Tax=Vulcanisaeta souniana JCM 11219 TaxID=1293586 RepID=A0A830EKK4_9CREN|nr:hypothetical protein GCM10007112_23790 [Vulcanisaeta souniana JCM 11219]